MNYLEEKDPPDQFFLQLSATGYLGEDLESMSYPFTIHKTIISKEDINIKKEYNWNLGKNEFTVTMAINARQVTCNGDVIELVDGKYEKVVEHSKETTPLPILNISIYPVLGKPQVILIDLNEVK